MYVCNSNVSRFKEIVGMLKCFLVFLCIFITCIKVKETLSSDTQDGLS